MIGRTVGHYEIVDLLGEGGMGQVFLARDLELGREVALKMVAPHGAGDPARRHRFIQEARAASSLNHPNIVTIHEIFQFEARDYVAMELIEGRTLRSLVGEERDSGTLIEVMRQLALAVEAAHAAGIVHRDIKPENAMLRPDGYVKLFDFGLARLQQTGVESEAMTASADEFATRPGALVGTTRYMSPEQAWGGLAGPPSDIFSLGLVFYELATGVHPFRSTSTAETLQSILHEPAPEPSRLVPELSAALDELLLSMLAKRAEDRPTASEVRAAIAALAGSTGDAPRQATVPERPCVGRTREMARLREVFEDASAGSWTLLNVAGEAGLGKTTLVDAFLRELAAHGTRAWIARGQCPERLGGSDALLPILESLEGLMRGDAGDRAARALKRFAPTWYVQVTSVTDGSAEALAQSVQTASPERMKRELHAFFEELAKSRPVVLFFEDVHWADTSTCELISYLASRGRDLPVLLIASYRPSELGGGQHVYQQVRLRLQGRGASRDLPLGFLSRAAIEELLALHLGEDRFPEELVELFQVKTEGSPLFVSDLLRYLRDDRSLVEKGEAWVLTRSIAELEEAIPETTRSMIELKLERIPEADHRLLVAAAVQGLQFDSAVVARATERDPAEVEERLQQLAALHGVVRNLGEEDLPDGTLSVRYRFVHAFYQNAFFAKLTPTRRAALAAAVSGAIVDAWGEKVRARAADLGFLFEAARDFARAGTQFLLAARQAARVFAYPEARILAERGLRAARSLPESGARDRLELPLSVTLGMALMTVQGYAHPDVERAHLRSRELCVRLGDERRLLPVRWGLWTLYLIGGRLKQALEVAREMLEPAELSQQPAMLMQALHATGTTLAFMGRLREARGYLERILEIYETTRQPFQAKLYVIDPSVTTLAMLGRLLASMGFLDQGLEYTRRGVDRARRLEHAHSLAYATFFVGWVHHMRGDVEATRAEIEASMAISEEHQLHQIREWGRVVKGWTLCATGDDARGIGEMRQSLSFQAKMHSRLERPYCLSLLAAALTEQGEWDEALALTDEALEIAERNEDRSYEPEIHRVRGELLAARAARGGAASDALCAQARDAFDTAYLRADAADAQALELRAAVSRLRFEQRLGDPGPARASLAELLGSFAEGTDAPVLADARALLG